MHLLTVVTQVTLEARQMLIVQQGLSIQQKLASIESLLRSVARMQANEAADSVDSSSPDVTGGPLLRQWALACWPRMRELCVVFIV